MNPGGGVVITSADGYIFLALLVFGTLVSVLAVVSRSHAVATDHGNALADDVDTGLRLLQSRIDAVGETDDPEVGQALADARSRLAVATALRAESAALPVLRACRRALLEGLTAVREAEQRTGGDSGPEIPLPTDAPLVPSPVRVRIEGAEHVALPAYAPGYPCCYSGGLFDVGEVPGGWYAEPFWERLLARGSDPDTEPDSEPDSGPEAD